MCACTCVHAVALVWLRTPAGLDLLPSPALAALSPTPRRRPRPRVLLLQGASQFLWLETEAMRAMGAEQLLTTFGRFAGLPTEHLARLPADVRGSCEAPRRGRDAGVGRRLLQQQPPGRVVDGRMAVHVQRALPADTTAQLQAAFRPFNELLRTLLADLAPTLRGVHWLQ